MLRDLVLDQAPAAELVTVDEVRRHLRLDGITEHDGRLEAYLATAIGELDGYSGLLGRALAAQTWILYLDRFPCAGSTGSTLNVIALPLPPLISVDLVRYTDGAGDVQTLAADQYEVLTGERAQLRPAYGLTWPSTRTTPRAVEITFTCGWAAPEAGAPWPAKLQPIRSAILLRVEQLFSGFDTDRETAIRRLLKPLTIPRV